MLFDGYVVLGSRWVALGALLVALPGLAGCASMGPAEQRQARHVLHSERFVQTRSPQRLSLERPVAHPGADWISARINQTSMCGSAYRERVATTTVTSHQTKNIAIETVVALGVAAAGGVALAVSPGMSDVTPPGSESSPRETARALGALGIGTGAVMLGHVVWVAVAASDKESEPMVSEQIRAASGVKQECGTERAGPGALVATLDRKEIKLAAFPAGALDLNLRSKADLLCGDPNDSGSSAALEYVLEADDQVRIGLGELALRSCVTATAARRKLQRADTQLTTTVDVRSVALAVKLLREAESLVGTLPAADSDLPELKAEVARLKTAASDKAAAVAEAATKEALGKIEAGAEDAAPSALAAIEVAMLNATQDRARSELYGAFGRQRNASRYSALAYLIDNDRGARDCLERRSGCSAALGSDRWQELLSPLVESASEAVGQRVAKLQTATKNIEKTQTAKTLASFDDATAQAKAAAALCELPLGSLVASCASLTESRAQAQAFADGREAALSKLRKEIAEKQRAEALRNTSARWRRHFAECSQLQHAIRALESVSSCEASCQAVIAKMRTQREKLRSFDYTEIVDDPAALQKLVGECQESGCETCP
jgi:hypothetical protein